MAQFPNITLAILSGGKAKRFGGISKALLKYNGEPFIGRIHRILSPLFGESIAISNSPFELNFLGIRVYNDIFVDKGPLGGIHSAMVNAQGRAIFVVSCDMPFVCTSIANKLLSLYSIKNVDSVVPKVKGCLEPLFAIYNKSCLSTLDKLLNDERSHPIRDCLNLINTHYMSLPDTEEVTKCFTNINTPQDLNGIDLS